MNHSTISAECAHGVCSACEFEDCACECHLPAYTGYIGSSREGLQRYQDIPQTADAAAQEASGHPTF